VEIDVPREILGVRRWQARVRSTRNVATLMRELVLELPEGEAIEFRAGAYVLVTCPPHATELRSVEVEADYRPAWDRLGLWDLRAASHAETARAYSIASHPGERGIVTLLVRLALPPPGAEPGTPPGLVSSYLFARRAGDPVEIAGPYGAFGVVENEREMILIGGGAGMAPLRSIVFDQLRCRRTRRRLGFWYGARNLQELFYREDFDALASEFDNFRWHAALSEPREEDGWTGDTGFIHEVVYERYLKDHPAPEECDYYLCGPPMMLKAALRLLERLGVDRENVRFDDFGT
jgi:Na+-transporting NADH:ubiquinone oxidoreductase subunit F